MKTSIVIKSLFICSTLAAAATYALINKEDASAPELSNHQIIDNETIDLSGYWDNASLSHLLSDRLWFGAESEADNGMISFWSHSDEGVNKPVVITWNDQQIFTDEGIADAVIATDESYLIAGTSWFDHSSPANAAAWQGYTPASSDNPVLRTSHRFSGSHTGPGFYSGYMGDRSSKSWVTDGHSDAADEPTRAAEQLADTLEWYGVSESAATTPANPELGAVTGGGSEAPDESKETAEEGAKEPVAAKPVSVPAPSPLILLSLCVSALLMKNHWARRSQTA